MATTTFCWLPPERLPASTSAEDILMVREDLPFSIILFSLPRSTVPSLAQIRSRLGRAMLLRMESLVHRPSFFRSSGASTMP